MKKNNTAKFLSLIVIFLTVNIFAQSLQSFKTEAAKIKTIKTSFIQKKYLRILNKPLQARGKLYFHSDGLFRWEYTYPVKSILLKNKNTINRYVDSGNGFKKESSQGMKAMGVIFNKITKWLKGDFSSMDFHARAVTKGGRVIITLTPKHKSMKKFISNIKLYMSRQKGVISSIRIFESKNNYTVITFYNVILNKQLPMSLFSKI